MRRTQDADDLAHGAADVAVRGLPTAPDVVRQRRDGAEWG